MNQCARVVGRRILYSHLLKCKRESSELQLLTARTSQHILSHTMSNKGNDKDPLANLAGNPYLDKYAELIRKRQESSPAEFQARLQTVEDEKKRKMEQRKEDAKQQQKKMEERVTQQKPKSLNEVMKMELIQDKTAEEIAEIWKAHHTKKKAVFAVIPADKYKVLYENSKQFTTFIYPLPRQDGYEFILQQFNGHEINFTQLASFQAYGENAPVCLTLTHYTELMENKGIVLMVGEPVPEVLKLHEAQLLAMQVEMYYCSTSGPKYKLLEQFNKKPDEFKHKDLIEEFQNLSSQVQKESEPAKSTEV